LLAQRNSIIYYEERKVFEGANEEPVKDRYIGYNTFIYR